VNKDELEAALAEQVELNAIYRNVDSDNVGLADDLEKALDEIARLNRIIDVGRDEYRLTVDALRESDIALQLDACMYQSVLRRAIAAETRVAELERENERLDWLLEEAVFLAWVGPPSGTWSRKQLEERYALRRPANPGAEEEHHPLPPRPPEDVPLSEHAEERRRRVAHPDAEDRINVDSSEWECGHICCGREGMTKLPNVDSSEWECDCYCHPDAEEAQDE